MDPRPQQTNTVEQLRGQLGSVLKAELESGELLEPDILELRSSAEKVMMWWNTRDPLLETGKIILPPDSPEKFYNRIDELSKLRISGALTLLIDVAYNGLTGEENEWASKIMEGADGQRNDSFFYSFLNISRLAIQQINKRIEENKPFTSPEVEELLTTAQLLMLNSRFWGSEIEREEFLKHARDTLTNVLEIIKGFCKTREYEHITLEELISMDDIRILGLKGSLLINSWAAKSKTPEEQRLGLMVETQNKSLLGLLDDISYLLCNPDNKFSSMEKRIKSPHIKGPLHEILWYLDITMLKNMYPKKYGLIFIKPVPSYADRPTINKPENNRAYDYYMFYRGKKGGAVQKFIQLKSSPQGSSKPGSNKNYHPRIDVLEEQNFMDINPNRLRAKIKLYQQIVEGGFRSSDAEKLDSYVLPTAKRFLEDFARSCGL